MTLFFLSDFSFYLTRGFSRLDLGIVINGLLRKRRRHFRTPHYPTSSRPFPPGTLVEQSMLGPFVQGP